MKPKIHYKRLLKLADFLETVPVDRFHLGWWLNFNSYEKTPEEAVHDCGTTACALGWAPSMPLVRRLGFGYSQKRNAAHFFTFKGRTVTPEQVARRLFGLDDREFQRVFCGALRRDEEYNLTPKQYAKRLRRWVKNRQAEERA